MLLSTTAQATMGGGRNGGQLDSSSEKRGQHILCLSSLDGADNNQVLEMLLDENRTSRIGHVTSLCVRGDVAGGWE